VSDLMLAVAVDDENPVAGDLRLVAGDLVQTSTLAEDVAQQLRVRFRFFLGEWLLDRAQGVPYLRDVLVKNPSLGVVRALVRRTIASTPGVEAVRSLSVELSPDRTCSVAFEAGLADGTVLRSSDYPPFLVT
jgi:hypothetical protein